MKLRSHLDQKEILELEAWKTKKALGYSWEHILSDQDLSVSPSQIIRFSAVIGRYKASQDVHKDLTSRKYRNTIKLRARSANIEKVNCHSRAATHAHSF